MVRIGTCLAPALAISADVQGAIVPPGAGGGRGTLLATAPSTQAKMPLAALQENGPTMGLDLTAKDVAETTVYVVGFGVMALTLEEYLRLKIKAGKDTAAELRLTDKVADAEREEERIAFIEPRLKGVVSFNYYLFGFPDNLSVFLRASIDAQKQQDSTAADAQPSMPNVEEDDPMPKVEEGDVGRLVELDEEELDDEELDDEATITTDKKNQNIFKRFLARYFPMPPM